MTADVRELRDDTARRRIQESTDTTLFVNAGAGSGKTSALVDRIVTLVMVDGVPLRHVAAVTFTEKAGAELRDRLRGVFEKVVRKHAEGSHDHDVATAALEDLDRAAIGTLHSFAQRILREHAIAAKLPPLVEVQDEVASSVAFDERWAAVQIALLDDDEMERPLLLALGAGVTLQHLRALMRRLGSDWDLLEERVLAQPERPVTVPDVAALRRQMIELLELREHCQDETDKLLAHFGPAEEALTALTAATDDAAVLAVLREIGALKFSYGRKGAWAMPLDDVKATCRQVTEAAQALVSDVVDRALRALTRWLAVQVLESAQQRRREGRLEFQDLLVLSRDLLRRDAEARDALQRKYRRLLLDEFQDTDPLQIEIAVRIASGAAADQQHWRDVEVPPGSLFVVGDAKQSIYKFRRADIATYLEAQDAVGERVSLTTNFRTVAPVLDWVNAVFSQLIEESGQEQPTYEALDQFRSEAPPVGPPVTVLGAVEHDDKPNADTLREREASDVAAVIEQALAEGWSVYDRQAKQWRPVRLGDIAVLVPARTSLPMLEEAFEAAGVPYRAEASSLVYEADEVRELLATARAVADPSDQLSLVTALRSPLFGCGDDDLWRWHHGGGRLRLWSKVPEDHPEKDGSVGRALAAMEHLARRARWQSPSEVLTEIITSRRMMEAGAQRFRRRDVWRRLRFVVDQARAWSEVAGGGMRAYLAWVARQSEDSARVAESVLPELDVDAVRIMTIHAAKGLEFPMVVLSGMTAGKRNSGGVRVRWPREGGYEVAVTAAVQTGDFSAGTPLDEQMDDFEKRRLLYVAATRARDHLVVSLHRNTEKRTTAARTMAEAGGADVPGVARSVRGDSAGSVRDAVVHESVADEPDWDEWAAGIAAARSASQRVGGITASGLEGTEPDVVLETEPERPAGADKGPRDLELPPWSKGRYGSAVGRAVHGVLQSVDLATGAGLEAAVEAQVIAEGVTQQREVVTALARAALGSELVQRAAAREHWSETYVGTVLDGELVEGYIDLVYREDDGSLVVVDYKTDAIPAEALGARTNYYRPQLDAYARCLRQATGAEVEARLLFLHPDGVVERAV